MRKRNKRIILTVVLAGLAYFVTRPMYYPEEKSISNQPQDQLQQKLLNQSVEISFDEMNRFLALWSEYLTKRMGKAGGYQVSLSNKELRKALPRKAVNWIEGHGWEVKRFFYVEQRLRSIVKAVTLKIQTQDNREILEKQLAETQDPSTAQSIMKLLDKQKDLYKIENVSEAEMAMVQPHLGVIRDILDGKLFYKPNAD